MRLRMAAVEMVVGLVAILLSVTPAAASCNPNRGYQQGNWFVGLTNSPGATVGGVYTDSWFYAYPYQNGGDTANWGMIDNNGCFGLCASYAQTGWLYRYSDGTHWSFWQWTHDGTYTTGTASPNGVNGFDRYMTLYNNTPGKFTFQVDSTVLDLEPAQWTPNEGQYASEILNQANQMPGDTSIQSGKHQHQHLVQRRLARLLWQLDEL